MFVVDDHPLVRSGLAGLIGQEPDLEFCGEASGAVEALAALPAAEPDLVIVDLSLAEGHGLQLVRQIETSWPAIRVLVFSMRDEKLYAEQCLQAGAEGYVHKQERPEAVLGAIRDVLAGRVVVSGPVADRVLHRLIGKRATDGGGVNALSDREFEVMELLGRGCSSQQIAERLHLSRKTVNTHRENLKRKLRLANATELLRFCMAQVEGQEERSEI